MFSDNPLLAQLKQQMQENLPKKEGIIKATERGFGFLEVDSKTRIFISAASMKKCMHGDKVKAIIRTENDKTSAEPQELIEPSFERFIGRVKLFKGRLNIIPDQPQLKKLAIKAKTRQGLSADDLKEGDWVVAFLTKHPLNSGEDQFFAEISQKITDAEDKTAPWWVTLAQSNLPNKAPVIEQNWQIQDDLALTRQDLTNIAFVTIDGASTQDMDDALYAKKLDDGNFELTIAIADPSAYILPEDATDKIARERGFTIYLPNYNVPMLPRELADDLCSLKLDQVRPALCCKVQISKTGDIAQSIEFFAANIKSHAKLAYDDVSSWLEDKQASNWQPQEAIKPILDTLDQIATLRNKWRQEFAVVFPDRPDYRFELSEDNDVIAIHADQRGRANKLVEEAMIIANICAGRVLKQKLNLGIFNTHAGFKEDKIADVISLIKQEMEIELDKDKLKTLDGFGNLRRKLARLDSNYLDYRIRRYQDYSEMKHQAYPHYAMGLDTYATWTSPIRKYGDMINHRLLKSILIDKTPTQIPDEALCEELAKLRRLYGQTERKVNDWLYTRTFSDEVYQNRNYLVEIYDMNRAGMRARMVENGASVFIPVSQIPQDKEEIVSSRELGTLTLDGQIKYKLGDQIEVCLIDVNLETRNLLAKPI